MNKCKSTERFFRDWLIRTANAEATRLIYLDDLLVVVCPPDRKLNPMEMEISAGSINSGKTLITIKGKMIPFRDGFKFVKNLKGVFNIVTTNADDPYLNLSEATIIDVKTLEGELTQIKIKCIAYLLNE